MSEEMIKELLEKLKQCDDFHNRCDFLMEHSEITYMLDYITNLQQENKKYKEVIENIICEIKTQLKENNHLSYEAAFSIAIVLELLNKEE